MRRFRFTRGDEWVATIAISGTSLDFAPPDNNAVAAAVKDLRALLPMDVPTGEDKYVRVRLRENDGGQVARIFAAIVQARDRMELEWEELP